MSNFYSFEVVGRGSETQLQLSENLSHLIYHLKGYVFIANKFLIELIV